MKVNQGYDIVNYKGIMDDLNKNIQRSKDEAYRKGLEKAKSIVKSNRVTDTTDLESKIKIYAFNNEVSLDTAAKIIIDDIFKNRTEIDAVIRVQSIIKRQI